MHRIDGAGNVNGAWVAENPATNQPPTEITAEWMNAIQEESIAVVVAGGIAPNKADNTQLLQAIRALNKKKGLSASALMQITAPTVLNASHVGATVQLALIASGAITLPLASSVENGDRIELWSNGALATVQRQAANSIFGNNTPITSFVMGNGDSVTLESDGVSNWLMVGGSVQLAYSAVFQGVQSNPGYQRLPSGLIIQFSSFTTSATADVAVTFPITFPTAVNAIIPSSSLAGAGSYANYNNGTPSGFNVAGWSSAGARAAFSGSYIAIGR